jgi:putative ABC transport system permease protein
MHPNWKQIVREHLAVLRLPPEREIEIVEELALHLEAAYEDALADGLSEAEAEARAVQGYDWRLLECELSRAEQPLATRTLQPSLELIERKGGIRMESLMQDLRFGARMLMKQPGFSLIAVLTLALGIGANTAIFSVVNAVRWRSLPYWQPEQLVMVWERSTREKMSQPSPNAPALFLEWRERKDVFSDIAAYEDAEISRRSRFFLTGGTEPERIAGAYVSGNLFSLLGVKATLGRTITVEEEQPGREQVVVLSDALWRRRFGAAPDVIGKTIQLNNKEFTIIGVTPPEFKLSYPKATELWTPLTFGPKERSNWNAAAYKVVARLKPGVTLQQAREAMTQLTQQLETPHKKSIQDLYVQLNLLHEYHFGEMQKPLFLLLGAVAAVLLIACVNVANLSLSRATDRGREIAVRAAMGASQGRLIRQMLAESLMLAALGGVIGVLLAFWGRNLLLGLMPSTVPRRSDVEIDTWVLGFTALLSISVGIVSGLAPAIGASKPDLNEALKAGGRSATAQASTRRWRDWFVVAEIALSFVLLTGAGLMIRSLWQIHRVALGFDPENVLTTHFTIPPYKFNHDEVQERSFIERVVERIKPLPGVVSAAAASSVPLRGVDYHAAGKIIGKPGYYSGRFRVAGNDYFHTMGVRVLKGRTFTEQDTQQSGKVVVVTDEFARRYFPNGEPLGQRLRTPSGAEAEIIGVVAVVRHKRFDQPVEPAYYLPLSQNQGSINTMSLVVRTAGDPLRLASAVRRAVWEEDKDQPLEELATMEQITAAAVSDLRFISITLGAFALLALLLSATGIYGVIAYSVAQRTHEFGVRMAMGAERLDVLRLVLARGMKLTLLGIAIGVSAALGLTQWMKSLLFGLSATDPLTFVAIAMLLTSVALIACWIPARRAANVDPMVAIRYE